MMKLKPEGLARLPDLRRLAVSAVFGLAAAMLCGLGLSILVSNGALSPGLSGLWSVLALVLGGLAAGLMAGGRRGALLTGGLTALMMLCALALLGGVAFGGDFSVKMCLMLLLIIPFSCIMGSVLASFIK